jgi:AcrR family transcriptional regulator
MTASKGDYNNYYNQKYIISEHEPISLYICTINKNIMSRPEITRQILIEKAAVMFNEKGIAGTSVDDILKASKVAKASLYGHFPGKAELSYATVDYMLAKIVEKRTTALSGAKTARDKIHAFLQFVKNPINSIFDGGCPIVNFSVESDDTNPVIKKKVRMMVENSLKLFTEILQDGIDSGEFSDRLNPEEYAQRMFISVEGANAICRVLNSVKPMQVVIKGLKAELQLYCTKSEVQESKA